MRKKGMVFYVGLVLVSLVLLTTTFLVLKELNAELPDYPIGEQQFSILNSYGEIMDTAATYEWLARKAADKAALRLAENGGHVRVEDARSKPEDYCGLYGNFQAWNKGDTQCFPDVVNGFQTYFDEEMLKAMERAGVDIEAFTITVLQDRIYGTAGKKVEFVKPVQGGIDVVEEIPKDYMEYATAYEVLQAIAIPETGGMCNNACPLTDERRYIRTLYSGGPPYSSAYGPAQITYSRAETYLKYNLFTPDERAYLEQLVEQGKQMISCSKSGSCSRQLNFGGSGYLGDTSQERELYIAVLTKIIEIDLEKNGYDPIDFAHGWYGYQNELPAGYLEKFQTHWG